jgi:hypothetical protein
MVSPCPPEDSSGLAIDRVSDRQVASSHVSIMCRCVDRSSGRGVDDGDMPTIERKVYSIEIIKGVRLRWLVLGLCRTYAALVFWSMLHLCFALCCV